MRIFGRALFATLLMPFLAAGMLTAIAATFAPPTHEPWLMSFYTGTLRRVTSSPSAWMTMAALGAIAAALGEFTKRKRSN